MLSFSCVGRTLLLLCFIIPGAAALVALHQPPVVAAPLGQDVLLPCELQESQDESVLNPPVLYWLHDGRPLLTEDRTSSDGAYELKNVRWSDGGTYECKMSVRTNRRGSFRLKGNNSTLLVYDTMTFNLTSLNGSTLRCEVNASQDLGLVLSVVKDGSVLRSLDSEAGRSVNRSFSALSGTVPLRGGGAYECQLLLEGHLITARTFHSPLTASGEDGNNSTCSDSLNVERYPEPWFLYASLLLVPALTLLILGTALLMQR